MKKCQPRALTPYVDGELSRELTVELEEHLRGCPSCGAMLDTLSIARDRVHSLGRSAIPDQALSPAVMIFGERARLDPTDVFGDDEEVGERRERRSHLALVEGQAEVAEEPPFAPFGAAEPAPAAPAAEWVTLEEPLPLEAGPAAVEATPMPEPPLEQYSWGDEPAALEPTPSPPWMAADGQSEADLLAEGRRAVEEQLAQPQGEAEVEPAPEPAGEPATAAFWAELDELKRAGDLRAPESAQDDELLPEGIAPPEADEAHAAVSRLRAELDEPAANAVRESAPAGTGLFQRLRAMLPGSSGAERAAAEMDAESALEMRLQPLQQYETTEPEAAAPIGAAHPAGADRSITWAKPAIAFAALAVVALLAAGGAFLFGPGANTSTTRSQAGAGPATAASVAPVIQASPHPSAAPAASSALPQLTGIVSKGDAGGSGYSVQRIRSGVPTAGVLRVVLDLQAGNGGFPAAQLGKGPDGYYLTVQGVSLDPAVAQSFSPYPGGVLTGISALPGAGVNLKLTTSQAQHYTLSYLTGPTRLVIDFSS